MILATRVSLYDFDLNLVRQGSLSGIRIHMAASKDYYIADTIGGTVYSIVFRKPFVEGVQGKAHESKPSIPEKFLSSARAMAFFRHLFAVHPVSQQVVATYWTPPRGELQLTIFDGVGNLLEGSKVRRSFPVTGSTKTAWIGPPRRKQAARYFGFMVLIGRIKNPSSFNMSMAGASRREK